MRWVIVIILATLISGCAVQEEQPSQVTEKEIPNEIPKPVVPVKELNCTDWAKSLFPEQWVYKQEADQDPELTKELLVLSGATWRDGSTIRGTSTTKIQRGIEKGENVNYYYTKPIFVAMDQDKYGYAYSEKIMDGWGNVLAENSFKIRPVFEVMYDNVKEEQDYQNNTVHTRYLSLSIAEPIIISCEKNR